MKGSPRENDPAQLATPFPPHWPAVCVETALPFDETQLWLELLAEDCMIEDSAIPIMHREAGELIAIFTTIVAKTRKG